ncbi:MAG: peroxiredoxin-like family protein, partial [Saprospiraceae bacterium]|nr:peroxiredoxin-like family protein [Saprospiraceae bacterium]
TAEGKRIRLSELLDEGPVVIVFYRGYWHGPCIDHLTALQDSLHLLTNAGLQLVAVSPERPESLLRTRQLTQATFPLISDAEGRIMKAFDAGFKVSTSYRQEVSRTTGVNIALNNGTAEAHLPVTATFVISHNQEVFWRHFDYEVANRAGISAILKAIKPRY